MAKKDKTGRKSFEDMSAKREAEVKASLEAASDRMADAQGEAMLANINRRTDEAKGERERVMKTAVNIGAPQASLGIGREDMQGNAGSTFRKGMNKSRFNVQKDLSEKADVARQEAVLDRMADAQGEAMLANIGRRVDEVKGEEERKRNYHLLQASAIRENEKRRMENTAVNVGEPPQSVERADIPGNAGRVFDQGIAKGKHVMRQDLQKMADEEAAKAASDRMAEAQGKAIIDNIKNHISNRERDAAEREEAERRKAKYLSDQQAAIRANQKQTEKPAAPANNEPGNSANTEVQGNSQSDMERVEAGRATRTEEQRGNASDKAGRPAPLVVHNAEERFQKNLEDVQGKLKYEPILEIIRKYQEEQQRLADNRTPEQKKKAARREKMAKIFAALGDGVAAMSNLVLASKGAIPYQSKSMISKAVGDRYDKFRKDLEERKAKSLALSERIAQLRQGVQKMQDEDERLRYARKKKEEDDKYNRERQEKLDNATIAHKNAMAGYYGEKAETDRRRLAVYEAMAKINAEAKLINANANMKRANKYQPGGSRSGKTWTFDGKTYNNLEEYKKAVEVARLELGIEPTYKTEYRSGFDDKETVRTKSTARVAAEVERARGGGKWGFSIHKK